MCGFSFPTPVFSNRVLQFWILKLKSWPGPVILTLRVTKLFKSSFRLLYRGADKSLARPGKKQARKHVRDARDFNKIETRAVIMFLFLQDKAPKEIHAILTETIACFLPRRAKVLSASLQNPNFHWWLRIVNHWPPSLSPPSSFKMQFNVIILQLWGPVPTSREIYFCFRKQNMRNREWHAGSFLQRN